MAVRKKARIDLFYDIASPYAWYAFEVLTRYLPVWNVDIQFRPFFLGGVMKGTGNRPPFTVPAKGKYVYQDLERCSVYFGVPLRPLDAGTSDFKRAVLTSIGAQRLLTAVSIEAPEFLVPLTREMWMRNWSRHEEIESPESFSEACTVAGIPGELSQRLIGSVTSDCVKEALRAETELAISRGAFGAPTITINNIDPDPSKMHLFFGSDRFEMIAALIGEKWHGPRPESNVERSPSLNHLSSKL